MKAPLLSLVIAFVACLPTGWLLAEEKADCPDNSCFTTSIIQEEKQGSCTTYTLEIGHDGSCRYALSHFSIEVPCGQITDVSNSEGWAMETGTTDPTTGITGIKIDDIKKFGESSSPGTFTVTYTVCSDNCESTAPGKVAYKASTCVHYQEPEGLYTPLSASILTQHISCAGSADGAINLSVSGGKEPYAFSWSNGSTTEDLEGVAEGTYSVTVSDATGESIQLETLLKAPVALKVSATVQNASCAGNGSVSLVVEGGTAPYTYLWNNNETTPSIQAPEGTYSVTVRDAKGCSLAESFIIGNTESLLLSLSGGTDCGDNTLEAQVSGGTAPFTYLWSTGETTSSIQPAAGGIHSLIVTDANGCTATAEKEVMAGEALYLTTTAKGPSCAYGTDGSIDLTVEGGSGEYSFSWSNESTSEDLENLYAGSYTVTVTDLNGCSAATTVVLTNPQSIFVRHTEIIQPDCNGTAGSISVEALFGAEPYTYSWSNGETGSSIAGLESDSYQVIVTDANGCSGTRTFLINEPNQPSVSISGGNCSTTLAADVSGGVAPYTYTWSTGETSSSIEITESGTYEVVVTDANGCSTTQTVDANDPSGAISLDYQVQEPTCSGDSNGSIDLILEGTDYTFSWSNGATTEDLTDLTAGTYSVTVSNSSGCTASVSIDVYAPNALFIMPVEIVNVNCQGEGGSISVETMFGTGPYTYEWNSGATGPLLENVEAGFYIVTVTDANGCTNSRGFSISEEKAPLVQITAIGCGENKEISAEVSGGKAPYSYLWADGQTESTVSGGAGVYQVTVTDAAGCSSSASAEFEKDASSVNVVLSVLPVSCAGGSDGSAVLEVSGGIAPYTFDWSGGSSGAEAKNLKAGVYSVNVTDATGCSAMKAFTVTEPKAISITAVAENSTGCGQPSGSINVQVTGGIAPYTYYWNTGAETTEIDQLEAGVYILTVEDANGCVAIRSFKIENSGGGAAVLASMDNCADTVICRGTSAGLPVYFTGEGPFNFTYTDGIREFSVSTAANPYMLEVMPQENTTYRLTGVSNSCGEGVAEGLANIQVSDCSKANICEDGCFSTRILKEETSGSCKTVTLQVSSDGNCRYALSHLSVAVGCGTVKNASNSAGWPMELNNTDPVTGLYGFKVDEIKNFGESKEPQDFTITYTVCSEEKVCQEAFTAACGPLIAYKAGSCVYYDKATEGVMQTVSQLSSRTKTEVLPDLELYPNPYEKGQSLNIKVSELSGKGPAILTIRSLTGIVIYKGNYSLSAANNLINLVLPQMPSGTFIVTLEVEGHVITRQLYVL